MAHKLFCFWFLKSLNCFLNSAPGNQTYFDQKYGSGTQESNETRGLKNQVKIKKKGNICDRKASDGEVVGPKSLRIQDLRIHGSSINQIRFSFWSFNFWPRSDFHQKTLKKCKK